MKKVIVLTAALMGVVVASQAGVHFDFGVNVPFPGDIIIGHPAPAPPPVVTAPPVVYEPTPAPVYTPPTEPVYAPPAPDACQPPVQVVTPPAVCAPTPPVVYSTPTVVLPAPAYYPRGHGFYAWRHEGWRHEREEHHGGWR